MHDPALHLFVDDHHIRNAIALRRVYFPLEQNHQAILTDTDGRYLAWGSAMRDEKRYRLWYHSVARGSGHEMAVAGVWGKGSERGYFPERYEGAHRETEGSMVGYAESDDGLSWNRPELGLIDWRGSKKNNMCYDGSGPSEQFEGFVTGLDSISVVRDEAEREAAKRYKMICHWESIHCWDNAISNLNRPKELMDKYWAHRAKYLTSSPDGIHWERTLTRIKNVEGGDYCGVTRDERNGQWMFADRPTVGLSTGYVRLAGLSLSKDLYHWPEHLEQVMFPGPYEDDGRRFEHHGWTPFNYGDQDLAVLELSIGAPPVLGILCSHRDGEQWKIHSYDVPLLKIGPKGADDDTLLAVTRNAPFAVGDKLRFLYNGRRGGGEAKDRFGGLFAAEMRLDGFAGMTVDTLSVQRNKKPAILQTQAMRVTQPQLQLNIAGHQQSAQVALLDDSMTALPGYDVPDCLPIEEDNVRAPVRWKNRADLSAIEGHDVHVLVKLEAGTIYSIRI